MSFTSGDGKIFKRHRAPPTMDIYAQIIQELTQGHKLKAIQTSDFDQFDEVVTNESGQTPGISHGHGTFSVAMSTLPRRGLSLGYEISYRFHAHGGLVHPTTEAIAFDYATMPLPQSIDLKITKYIPFNISMNVKDERKNALFLFYEGSTPTRNDLRCVASQADEEKLLEAKVRPITNATTQRSENGLLEEIYWFKSSIDDRPRSIGAHPINGAKLVRTVYDRLLAKRKR